MQLLTYKASWNAFTTHQGNYITISSPDDIDIEPGCIYELELLLNLDLPEAMEAIANINPESQLNLISIYGPVKITDTLKVRLFNPTPDIITITKGLELFKVDLYKQSITLGGVNYDKSSDTCSFGFNNLESSWIRIPTSQIEFQNLYIQETE